MKTAIDRFVNRPAAGSQHGTAAERMATRFWWRSLSIAQRRAADWFHARAPFDVGASPRWPANGSHGRDVATGDTEGRSACGGIAALAHGQRKQPHGMAKRVFAWLQSAEIYGTPALGVERSGARKTLSVDNHAWSANLRPTVRHRAGHGIGLQCHDQCGGRPRRHGPVVRPAPPRHMSRGETRR